MGINNIKYVIPADKQREIAAHYSNQNNPNYRETNSRKRNVRNQVTPNKQKYKGNDKLKKILAIGLSTLAVSGAIGASIISDYNLKELTSRDIQSEILNDAIEQINLSNLNFDGQNFNPSLKCSRPEMYKVLSNSDLDEKINIYLANPTAENKEHLIHDLEGREEEFAKFNMDLIAASLADSQGTTIDDISIKAVFNYDNVQHGDNIMKGTDAYIGHTLTIDYLEGYTERGKTNFKEIPEDIFNLISDAKFNYLAPDSSYFNNNSNIIERGLETYIQLKQVLAEHDFTIKNGKLLLQKDGKIYNYYKNLSGNAKFKEVAEERDR